MSSFGGSPSAEESKQHMVYKRASGRVRKLKKVKSTAAPLSSSQNEDHFPEQKINNTKNLTITPRHMIKFEMEDAKYSEEYEQLKKSRKLRIKRAVTDNTSSKNGTYRMEKFIAPDTFMQPKEFLRFLITDAITSSTRDSNYDKKETEEKKTAKRDTSAVAAGTTDSSTSETFKKVKITHPLSAASRTKHVSFEELPAKLQKTIESALNDAVSRGKANDGDFLKIYYGDKVIKIPVSLSKHISIKAKETTTAKSIIESYVHKTVHKYPKEEEEYKNSFFKETPKYETKYETKYYYPSTTERAESYVNFVTPKDPAPHVEEVHLPPKKSVYFFSSEEENTPTFESLKKKPVTPSSIIFESSTPSTLSTFSDLSKNYENHIIHPTSSPSLGAFKTIIKEHPRETIPITEEIVDDGLYQYKPLKTIHEIQHLDEHKPIPIPPPKSFIGFQGSTSKDEHIEKNYEFG